MAGGFSFEINVQPNDIPNLDDSHKRDCVDAVNRAINSVFKYTMIMCAAVIVFFGVYSFFSINYFMRMMKILPQITLVLPIASAACCVFEFVAGTMQRRAIVLEIILMAVILASSLMIVPTMWIIPFAAYGIIAHVKLFMLYPFHKVLSQQKGYPEFTPLPTKEEVFAKNAAAREKPAETAAEKNIGETEDVSALSESGNVPNENEKSASESEK